MRAAQKRIELQIDISNRQAYNTAALTGGAMGGKLPAFDKVFRPAPRLAKPQPSQVQEAMLRQLAIAWGAEIA